MFFVISISGARTFVREMSKVTKAMPRTVYDHFRFSLEKFSSVSLFQEFPQVKWRCQRYQRGALNWMQAFLFFVQKMFTWISRFFEVAQVKGRCQQYQRGNLNSLRAFLFVGPKFFSFIYRFQEGGQVKERCQRYKRDAL